jgi:hypothetical protein
MPDRTQRPISDRTTSTHESLNSPSYGPPIILSIQALIAISFAHFFGFPVLLPE